jgi:flagellar biosynthetic protein FliQ
MDPSLAVEHALQSLWMSFVLAGPALLGILIVGLVIGILQAATSVNESSVAFIPKLVVIGLVLVLVTPLSLSMFIDYFRNVIMGIADISR